MLHYNISIALSGIDKSKICEIFSSIAQKRAIYFPDKVLYNEYIAVSILGGERVFFAEHIAFLELVSEKENPS